MGNNQKIIVAPLNWGLGHATRCIPIIKALIETGYKPVIASDGAALQLLKKEFPQLEYIALPSYQIQYGKNLKTSLLLKTSKITKAARSEYNVVNQYVNNEKDLVGIISDNRFGVYSKKVPSIYLTHQLNVLSGWSTFFTTAMHQSIMGNFNECWVPDEIGSIFSGKTIEKTSIKTSSKICGSLKSVYP